MGKPPNQCDHTKIIESDNDSKKMTSMSMSVDGMLGMVTSRTGVYLHGHGCARIRRFPYNFRLNGPLPNRLVP